MAGDRLTEELFGGIDARKIEISPGYSWALLELAHDAHDPLYIAELIRDLGPDDESLRFLFPDSHHLTAYLARFGVTYAYVTGEEEVELVGQTDQVNKMGAAILAKRQMGARPSTIPRAHDSPDISWKRIDFEHDSVSPGQLANPMEQVKSRLGVESNFTLKDNLLGYMAKIGDGNYLRAVLDRVDLVGDKQEVDAIAQLLMTEELQDCLSLGPGIYRVRYPKPQAERGDITQTDQKRLPSWLRLPFQGR